MSKNTKKQLDVEIHLSDKSNIGGQVSGQASGQVTD